MKSNDTGIKRILKTFIYSWQGFTAAWHSEVALRQDVCLAVVLCLFGSLITVTTAERLLLLGCPLLILLMELINTAIETIVDLVSPDFHPLAKKAKDIGSLLVLLSFGYTIGVWVTILIQYYIN